MALVSLFSACIEDDSDECTQATWAGTYRGSVVCDGESESAQIVVTASGRKLLIAYETSTVEVTYDPLDFDGCVINEDNSLGTTRFILNGTVTKPTGPIIDSTFTGESLELKEVITSDGITTTCIIAGIKRL